MTASVSGNPEISSRQHKSRRRKLVFWIILLGLFAGVIVYLNSNAFHALIRNQAIARVEQITGGKVEIQSFDSSLTHLRFQAQGVTVHGTEGRDQAPYFHADAVNGQAILLSFLSPSFAFKSLIFEHPVIHLIVNADGSTNQPPPQAKQPSGKNPVEQLFTLEIGHLEARNGEIIAE